MHPAIICLLVVAVYGLVYSLLTKSSRPSSRDEHEKRVSTESGSSPLPLPREKRLPAPIRMPNEAPCSSVVRSQPRSIPPARETNEQPSVTAPLGREALPPAAFIPPKSRFDYPPCPVCYARNVRGQPQQVFRRGNKYFCDRHHHF